MNMAAIHVGYERLKACMSHDTCEQMNCAYFLRPEELTEILSFLEKIIVGAETCNNYKFESQGAHQGAGSAAAFPEDHRAAAAAFLGQGDRHQVDGSAAAPPEKE